MVSRANQGSKWPNDRILSYSQKGEGRHRKLGFGYGLVHYILFCFKVKSSDQDKVIRFNKKNSDQVKVIRFKRKSTDQEIERGHQDKVEHPRSLRKQNRGGQIIQVDGKKMNTRDLCVSKTDGVIGANFRYFHDKTHAQRLLRVEHSEHFHKFLKSGRIECFCEDVSGLLVGFDFNDLDMFLFDTVTDEMVFDLNVFGFRVLNEIFGDVRNCNVVTEDRGFMKGDAIIKHLMVYPTDLGTTKGCSNVFSFCCGLRNGGLFLTLLGHESIFKKLATPRSDLRAKISLKAYTQAHCKHNVSSASSEIHERSYHGAIEVLINAFAIHIRRHRMLNFHGSFEWMGLSHFELGQNLFNIFLLVNRNS
ncbi:hypothetical protein L1987_15356 [Smallanthus sonchifolius]|uniref:Uncharacterized protein n=1 Tax=Smallanthus sonchifolius TaxID=185202 RepID=A0ACB9J5Q0_9ASTR|nr:hypothetical protein L1987_15356 [Smallanthus sonchifolius]